MTSRLLQRLRFTDTRTQKISTMCLVFDREAHDMFASVSSRRHYGAEPNVHRTSRIFSFSISRAKDPPPKTFTWSFIVAIHQFMMPNLQVINFMIFVFGEADNLWPESVSNGHRSGPKTGIEALRWPLFDEANCLVTVEPANPAEVLKPHG